MPLQYQAFYSLIIWLSTLLYNTLIAIIFQIALLVCPEGVQISALLCSERQCGTLTLANKNVALLLRSLATPTFVLSYAYTSSLRMHARLHTTATFVPSYAHIILQGGSEFFDKGVMEFFMDEGFDASMKGDVPTSTRE